MRNDPDSYRDRLVDEVSKEQPKRITSFDHINYDDAESSNDVGLKQWWGNRPDYDY